MSVGDWTTSSRVWDSHKRRSFLSLLYSHILAQSGRIRDGNSVAIKAQFTLSEPVAVLVAERVGLSALHSPTDALTRLPRLWSIAHPIRNRHNNNNKLSKTQLADNQISTFAAYPTIYIRPSFVQTLLILLLPLCCSTAPSSSSIYNHQSA